MSSSRRQRWVRPISASSRLPARSSRLPRRESSVGSTIQRETEMAFYGNVPEEDVTALQNAVRIASNVIARLPALSPSAWRESAYELVLGGILEDWVANGTNELDDEDEDDLGNLLRVSADL